MTMRCIQTLLTGALGLALFAAPTLAGDAALSDPTRPWKTAGYQGQQASSAGSYTLSSTLVSSTRRVAVINGRHVIEGEAVGNATVLKIRKHDVILQSPQRQITLKLLPDIVKKQP
ncbi:MAG: hypothetical protein HKP57_02030 [Halobacteria archaeon]|nr:hypothetical protein [Halobacteria archaeon]